MTASPAPLALASAQIRPDVGSGFVIHFAYSSRTSIPERLRRGLAGEQELATLHGNDAVRAARVLLPRINRAGGRPSDIATAVSALERGRSVDELFSDAARTPRESIPFWKRPVENWGPMQGPFVLASSLPTPVRLALEMALHEAEEIAAIADDLLVPPASRAKIDADKPR